MTWLLNSYSYHLSSVVYILASDPRCLVWVPAFIWSHSLSPLWHWADCIINRLSKSAGSAPSFQLRDKIHMNSPLFVCVSMCVIALNTAGFRFQLLKPVRGRTWSGQNTPGSVSTQFHQAAGALSSLGANIRVMQQIPMVMELRWC